MHSVCPDIESCHLNDFTSICVLFCFWFIDFSARGRQTFAWLKRGDTFVYLRSFMLAFSPFESVLITFTGVYNVHFNKIWIS